MKLNLLNDQDLLSTTKKLAHQERDVLTQILSHLREIERRRLYCDLGFSSLFDYAVIELQYSEGQAGRRIQAMRLIKEIPEVELKIASGQLNLSNVARAQSFFREVAKSKPDLKLATAEKLSILGKLENKSSRQGEVELLRLLPEGAPPKTRERVISEEHTEIKFVIDNELKEQLDEVRALAGPRGLAMDFKELLKFMAEVSTKALNEKKFGKKASLSVHSESAPTPALGF